MTQNTITSADATRYKKPFASQGNGLRKVFPAAWGSTFI